jgi:DNA-binding LacI/PurR family transcriptional regulator
MEKARTPTLTQISTALGLSKTAVSRALRDMPDISAETKTIVQEYAARVGYRPNHAARVLVTSRTRTIGLGMGSYTNPFFQEVTFALLHEAREAGLSVLLLGISRSEETGRLEVFPAHGAVVDGLVLLQGWYEKRPSVEDVLNFDRTVAPTLFRGNMASDEVDQIAVDWRGAAYDLTRYLLMLGHRRIGILRGISELELASDETHCQKTAGSRQALQDFGLDWDQAALRRFPSRLGSAKKAALELLLRDSRPTALICHTDYLALGAMRAARELGLRVPEDLSIAGFNDIELGAYLPTALTTVSQDKRAIAREIVDRIKSRTEDGRLAERFMSKVPHELIIRESCAPPTP